MHNAYKSLLFALLMYTSFAHAYTIHARNIKPFRQKRRPILTLALEHGPSYTHTKLRLICIIIILVLRYLEMINEIRIN